MCGINYFDNSKCPIPTVILIHQSDKTCLQKKKNKHLYRIFIVFIILKWIKKIENQFYLVDLIQTLELFKC